MIHIYQFYYKNNLIFITNLFKKITKNEKVIKYYNLDHNQLNQDIKVIGDNLVYKI